MKNLLSLILGMLAAAAFAGGVVSPDAKLEKLSGGFAFTEWPACDAKGNVFFTDQPNDRIMEWSADGRLSAFLQPCGRANGMMFDTRGNLIACADEHNQLWSIAPDKSVTVLVTNFSGKYLNGPNDVWIAPNGGMYLTDPFYLRSYWDHQTKALTSEDVFTPRPTAKHPRVSPAICTSPTASPARPTASICSCPTSPPGRLGNTTSSRMVR